MVGVFERFREGIVEGSFCFDSGSGMTIGSFAGAGSGAWAGFSWVGRTGNPLGRSI